MSLDNILKKNEYQTISSELSLVPRVLFVVYGIHYEHVPLTYDETQIKEHRWSQIISIMVNAIYQEQRKLSYGLRHVSLDGK